MPTTPPNTQADVKRTPFYGGSLFRSSAMSIGRRLTLCFLLIMLAMIVADAAEFWTFRQMVAPMRRLSNAERAALALVRIRLDVGTFRKNVAALESSHDTKQFSSEVAELRQSFLRDLEDAEQALTRAPEFAREDPTIPAALKVLKITLPSQLDAAVQLADAEDWAAVQARLRTQIQELIDLSSQMVASVDRQSQQQAAKAIRDAEMAQQRLFLVVPVAGLLTLLLAIGLGWYATQSITVPLAELEKSAQALAGGNFQHQVNVTGNDELAVVGNAFNHAARQLQELYEELQEQASLLSLTHDSIYVSDLNGIIRYWNRGAESLYGWPAAQAVGEVAQKLLKTVFPLPLEQIDTELLSRGHWEGELCNTKKDGTQVVVASRWSLKRDDRGAAVAILVTSNDITQRKRAEEELRHHAERLQLLYAANLSLTQTLDLPTLLQQLLEVAYQLIPHDGMTIMLLGDDGLLRVQAARGYAAGADPKLSVGVPFAAATFPLIDRVLKNKASILIPDTGTNPDWILVQGAEHVRNWLGIPLVAGGTVIGLYSLDKAQPEFFTADHQHMAETLAGPAAVAIQNARLHEQTQTYARELELRLAELKRAEEAVRQSEKQLRDVIETIPAIAWTNSPDGTVEFVNKRWQEYTGMSSESSLGSGWQTALHAKDVNGFLEKRRGSLATGEPFEEEVRIRCGGSGEYRWFICRAVPLRDGQENIVKWYGTAIDIHDRKLAEERLQVANVVLREEIDKASMFEEVVGASRALQAVLSGVAKVAPTDSTVLLTGETGTGKELIARAIHKKSARSAGAFIAVNCASIPESLIASELFGHEKGAFTGALQRRLGRFELAEGGTIFLDEVGELPLETQIALLRVLQEREIQRVGGTQTIRVNVRVLGATNRNLERAIAAGTFREDLFYRLNVFPIHIPPLRERKEDIPMLVEYFIDRFARMGGKHIRSIEKRALDLLESYSWPGNIRELQNIIERAVIVCDTETLAIDSSWLSLGPEQPSEPAGSLANKIHAQEREFIEKALAETEGKVSGPSGAAAKLGISPSALEYKIRLLKINKHQFKKYLREN